MLQGTQHPASSTQYVAVRDIGPAASVPCALGISPFTLSQVVRAHTAELTPLPPFLVGHHIHGTKSRFGVGNLANVVHHNAQHQHPTLLYDGLFFNGEASTAPVPGKLGLFGPTGEEE